MPVYSVVQCSKDAEATSICMIWLYTRSNESLSPRPELTSCSREELLVMVQHIPGIERQISLSQPLYLADNFLLIPKIPQPHLLWHKPRCTQSFVPATE